jgi:hypothetical protein
MLYNEIWNWAVNTNHGQVSLNSARMSKLNSINNLKDDEFLSHVKYKIIIIKKKQKQKITEHVKYTSHYCYKCI